MVGTSACCPICGVVSIWKDAEVSQEPGKLVVKAFGEIFQTSWDPKERMPYPSYRLNNAWTIVGEMMALHLQGVYNDARPKINLDSAKS